MKAGSRKSTNTLEQVVCQVYRFIMEISFKQFLIKLSKMIIYQLSVENLISFRKLGFVALLLKNKTKI
jgi:hypothetical protein